MNKDKKNMTWADLFKTAENQPLSVFYNNDKEWDDLPSARKPRKPKPPTLATAIKKAKAAGMDVTIARDGSVTFKFRDDNHAIPTPDDELAQWRMKRANSR